MTEPNQTNEMPERIWAHGEMPYIHAWSSAESGPVGGIREAEYIRADVHAAVVAERDKAQAEIAKAMNAMDHGVDDSRWMPGESAVDALIRERDMAREEVARLRESLKDILEWIDNWSPDFVYDKDWPDSKKSPRRPRIHPAGAAHMNNRLDIKSDLIQLAAEILRGDGVPDFEETSIFGAHLFEVHRLWAVRVRNIADKLTAPPNPWIPLDPNAEGYRLPTEADADHNGKLSVWTALGHYDIAHWKSVVGAVAAAKEEGDESWYVAWQSTPPGPETYAQESQP